VGFVFFVWFVIDTLWEKERRMEGCRKSKKSLDLFMLCFPLLAAVSIGAQTVCLGLLTKNNIPFNL
jgi:hypothetical protein